MALVTEVPTLAPPQPAVIDAVQSVATPEQTDPAVRREVTLRRLLDGPYQPGIRLLNYESVRDRGMLDLFEYDPETGEDAIVHILAGDVVKGPDGAEIAWGFHHEPSAPFGPDHTNATYVDRKHLNGLGGRKLAEFTPSPFEPYKARTVIAGRQKMTTHTDPTTGERHITEAKAGMFPKEYDGLMVLQAIRIAAETRDKSQDEIQPNGKILNHGYAPMIDGQSLMKINLVLNSGGDKIVSGFPIVKIGGIMKLSEEAIKQCLYLS